MTPTFFALLPFLMCVASCYFTFKAAYEENKAFEATQQLLGLVIWSVWVVIYFIAPEYFASLLVKTL